jgi:hypothetical protein
MNCQPCTIPASDAHDAATLPAAAPPSARPRCCGRESKFLAAARTSSASNSSRCASLLTFGEKLDLTMDGPPFALAGSTNGGKGRRDRPDRHRAPHADRPPHQRTDRNVTRAILPAVQRNSVALKSCRRTIIAPGWSTRLACCFRRPAGNASPRVTRHARSSICAADGVPLIRLCVRRLFRKFILILLRAFAPLRDIPASHLG